eukprot:TRINITY_DN1312_c0_g1_i1.p1 TRINITY_DN1312_c0_g1~~TRINITY_DN1312_c0_g1_i1.p1  ORF type:complete len:366 (-),score=84.71 TRINITY_DN1312_c0_g1_i1:7-1104(-)
MLGFVVLSALFLVAHCSNVQISWNEAGSTSVSRQINIGDSVTWTTTDYSLHTISGTNNEILNSTYISANSSYAPIDSWTYTFDVEGSYDFQCLQHPNTMYGTITVVRAGRSVLTGDSVSGTDTEYYRLTGTGDAVETITLSLSNPSSGNVGIYVGVNRAPEHDSDADYYTTCSGADGTQVCRVTIPPCGNSVLNTYNIDVAPLVGSSGVQYSISATSESSQFVVTVNGTACCNAMSYFTVSPTTDYPVTAISITRTSGAFVSADSTDPSWGMFVRTDSQGCPDSENFINGQDVTFSSGKDTYIVKNLPVASKYTIGVNVPSATGASFTINALATAPADNNLPSSGATGLVAGTVSTFAVLALLLL